MRFPTDKPYYLLSWFVYGIGRLDQFVWNQDEAHNLFSNLAGELAIDSARLIYVENGVEELVRSF
jgi:hypothetical protein